MAGSRGAPRIPSKEFLTGQLSPKSAVLPRFGTPQSRQLRPPQFGMQYHDVSPPPPPPPPPPPAPTLANNVAGTAPAGLGKGGIGGNGFNVNQAASGALQDAMGATAQGMQYQPMQAANLMGSYQNPYEQQVIDRTMRDLGTAQSKSLNQLDAQAGAANAFGGSRHGIEAAETRGNYAQKAIDAVGGMRNQGFNTALGAAQFDIGNRNNAMATRLGAANQMAGLGGQAFGIGQTIQGNQMRDGMMQQGLQQALIDAARNQYAGYTGAPMASTGPMNSALGITPVPQSTTTSRQPGLFDYLSVGMSLVPGL